MKRLLSAVILALFALGAGEARSEFAHTLTLTVNYSGAETLVDFPVLVRLPPHVTSRMRTDGLDIRFYTEDGATELAHEMESLSRSATATSLCWVKVPSLTTGTKLLLKFGDADFATAAASAATWSGYIGVWHLDNIKTSCVDATGGTANGSVDGNCKSVSGKLGTACQMIYTPNWTLTNTGCIEINNTSSLATAGKVTVSWWMNPNASGAMPRSSCASYNFNARTKKGHSIWNAGYVMSADAAPKYCVYSYKYNSWDCNSFALEDADTQMNLPGWTHVAFTLADDAGGATSSGALYVNTNLLASGSGLYPVQSMDNGGVFRIGTNNGLANYKGQMDEVRVRAAASSATWIKAEYDSVNDESFVVFSEKELEDLSTTRRVVATAAEKTGDWADAAVAGDDAYAALQGRLDASGYGDTVLVKAGTYILTNQLLLASQSHDGVTLKSDDGEGNLARKTTIFYRPETVSNRFVYISALHATVEGFTLTNGFVSALNGGGAYLANCGADSGLRSCDVVGCKAWDPTYETSGINKSALRGAGGGAFIETTGCISNCLFLANTSLAGAVFMKGTLKQYSSPTATPRATGCQFVWNVQGGKGVANECNGSAVATQCATCLDHSSIVSNFCNVTGSPQISTVGSYANYLIISNCFFMANGLGTRNVKVFGSNSGSNNRCTGNVFYRETAQLMSSVDGVGGNAMIECTSWMGVASARNSLFVGNTYTSGCLSGAGTVQNCTFINNTGCIYSNGSGTKNSRTNRVYNCIFYGNTEDVYATNSGNANPVALFMSNCCVRTSQFNGQGRRAFGSTFQANNFTFDDSTRADYEQSTIRFRDITHGIDYLENDYRLKRNSRLRDKALKFDWMTGSTDLDGRPRVLNRRGKATADALPDIGCYECEIPKPGAAIIVN